MGLGNCVVGRCLPLCALGLVGWSPLPFGVAEEYITGKLLKKRVRFTKIEADKHIEFAPTFWLLRLFLPRFIFHIDRHGDHCKIASRIHIRIGPLAKQLNQKEFDAVRQHMRDEGQNLKRLLEGSH